MNRFVRDFVNDQILRAFAIGVAFHLLTLCVMALPFCWIWNALAPVYGLGVLPPPWLQLPYWHVVGLFALPKICIWSFGAKVEFGQ